MAVQPRPKTVTYHFDNLTAVIDYQERMLSLDSEHGAMAFPFSQLGLLRAVFQAIGHQMPEYGSGDQSVRH